MKYYWVGTATGDRYLEASGHFIGGNYEYGGEGQQPYVSFYREYQSNQVGMFILKNLTGWAEISRTEYETNRPLLISR